MKILVTGAAGFLGRHIVALLKKKKHVVVTVVRATSDTRYLEEQGVELVHGDLRDENCVKLAMKGVDAVVHAAAALRGKREDFFDVNVRVTENLLKQAAEQQVKRFVFISSIIVYDHSSAPAGQIFHEEMPYEEKEQTLYCETKIAAEKLVTEYHAQHKLPTVILRPAALYGKHGPLFVSRLGLPLGANRYLVFGNGKLPLALSHVESVADAVALALSKRAAVGRIYNVTEDGSVTQNEFIKQVRDLVRPDFRAWKLPYWLARGLGLSSGWLLGKVGMASPLNLAYMRLCVTPFYYSNNRLKEELGWRPRSDFKESLREMMLWHRQRLQPKRPGPDADGKVRISADQVLRVGVVGCGVIAGPHLQALKRLKNARVAALCDPVPEAREKLAQQFRVPATYADYKEMLTNEELDVVHVCTPAQTHAEIALAAMKHGCHVLVEKPMAANAAEARKMVAAAKKHKVKLCVDHNHVYDPVMLEARRVLAQGGVGRVAYVEALYGNSFSTNPNSGYMTYAGRSNWAYALPGALHQNFISHPISLLLDVLGDAEVGQVHARYHRVVPHMKTDELYVTFDNADSHGLLRLSNAVAPRYLLLTVYGTEGTLRVDFLNRYLFLDRPLARVPRVIGRSVMAFKYGCTLLGSAVRNVAAGLSGRYNLYQGNETLIRLFYRSILLDEPPPVSGEEGLRSMEIMDRIWQNLPTGNGVSELKRLPEKKPRRKRVRPAAETTRGA